MPRGVVAGLAVVLAAEVLASGAVLAAPTAVAAVRAAATSSPSAKPSGTKSPSAKPSQPAKPIRRPGPPGGSPPTPVRVVPMPKANCPGLRPGASGSPIQPAATVPTEPWAQQALGFSSVWDLTRGSGVTVAVIDSGVDYAPRLPGPTAGAIDLTGTGYQDCVGHGTEVAAIIAAGAATDPNLKFAGVAPGALILSIKWTNQEAPPAAQSAKLAQGIYDAANLGAQVINVSATAAPSPQLQGAVYYAIHQKDAVVVAAAGNDQPAGGSQPAVSGPFYPANYPGVLSVGAVNPDGGLAWFSDRSSRAQVTAPGSAVTSAWPGHGYYSGLAGTSYATAFVSGTAALVRARFPRLTQAQVVARIEATADGQTGLGTGYGMVSPVLALTSIRPASEQPGASGPPAAPGRVSVAGAPAPDPSAPAAMAITAGEIGAAAVTVIGVIVVRVGRRRRWLPGSRSGPA